MEPKYRHTPASTRPRCPVCQESVYSPAGVHPQCCLKLHEPPRPKPVPRPPAPHPAKSPVGAVVSPSGADARPPAPAKRNVPEPAG